MLKTLQTRTEHVVDSMILVPTLDVRSRYAIAVAIVASATCIGYLWSLWTDARNLSLVFFGAVLLTGVWLGTRAALFAAGLAFVSYNFFLVDPRLSLRFAAADFLALGAFLAGALVVGGLAGRLSDRARDATRRLRELIVLFEASRELSAALRPDEAAAILVRHIERDSGGASVWLVSGGDWYLACATDSRAAMAHNLTKEGVERLSHAKPASDGLELFPLETGGRRLGAVAVWPPDGRSAHATQRRWLSAILELGAVAIDRARLMNEVAEASVVAEKEGLRTALLSSLSHDLRTPIATILASATALQEHETEFDAATRTEILETIQDEAERLNRYVANLLDMTRLESGALQLNSVLIDADEAMASALERVARRLKGRRVLRVFERSSDRILVDPVLLEQAIVNILENAIAHSPENATILASTKRVGKDVVLSVEDEGPGIPSRNLERIFDKFFRGRSDRAGSGGVGLGLSVSRGLIESFGGEVRAVSPAAGGKGARFEITLPAHAALVGALE